MDNSLKNNNWKNNHCGDCEYFIEWKDSYKQGQCYFAPPSSTSETDYDTSDGFPVITKGHKACSHFLKK